MLKRKKSKNSWLLIEIRMNVLDFMRIVICAMIEMMKRGQHIMHKMNV